MDVKRGCCWRCEKKIKTEVPCSSCGLAKYCMQKCRERDQWRHKQECDNWKPKKCSNCDVSGQLRECSACCNAWCCGETCQRAHWKTHKPQCQERTQEIKGKVLSMGFRFQYMSGNPLISPYYIGNALAIDMLNLSENECTRIDDTSANASQTDPLTSKYSILSCGCGNLRNWILSVASLPPNFKGILHTTLNDFDPYVQARNVLQLYMMIIHQDDNDIAETITSIWYSLHLTEKDYTLLVNCLTALQDITADDLKKAAKGVLELREADLPPMRDVWQAWLNLKCQNGQPNYINLQKQRQDMLQKDEEADDGNKLYRKGLPREFLPSYNKYSQNGDFNASGNQNVLYDNPTLTGYMFPKDNVPSATKVMERIAALSHPKQHRFVYCIESHLSAFCEWDFLQVKRCNYNKSLVVMFHSYISMQIKQAISHLKAGHLTVSMVIWNCLELHTRLDAGICKFDRIFTSNIADFAGTQPLLKELKPFLNEANRCSAIFTQYWNWYAYFPWAMIGGPSGLTSDPNIRGKTVAFCGFEAMHDTYADNEQMQTKLKNPENRSFMIQESMKAVGRGHYFCQEYFNSMSWFVSYLRADFMTYNGPLSTSKGPPSFQKVKQSQGLILRDFRQGKLNKVVPYRYRRNVRLVNMMRGMERVLEWHLP